MSSDSTHKKGFPGNDCTVKEKRRAKATRQVTDAPIKISHLLETFRASNYAQLIPEQQDERLDPASIDLINSQHISAPEIADPFEDFEDGIFIVERDPIAPSPLPLSVISLKARKWESIPVIIRQPPTLLG